MAYDEGLAQRIREIVEDTAGSSEKKMFGGLCFLVSGNMCCGVTGDELMVRVGPDAYEDALARAGAREMDFTGRAMRGMVYVSVDAIEDDDMLGEWVGRGAAFAGSLPAKSPRERK